MMQFNYWFMYFLIVFVIVTLGTLSPDPEFNYI